MALEREVKLRFASADDARERVRGAGAEAFRGRRLQRDSLFDTADQALGRQGIALRHRSDGDRHFLTVKGPVHPGRMKLRDEHETAVADGAALLAILDAAGFRPWFRYEKYREEFRADGVVIAVDETPVGVFVEIEGAEDRIHAVARALGRTPDDYITDSYRALFLAGRPAGAPDGDMTFPDVPVA